MDTLYRNAEKDYMKKISLALITVGITAILLHASSIGGVFSDKKAPDRWLLEIYKEVQEFGFRDQEDFIKREFHLNLDGNWNNREEHVVVLSHKEGSGDKMILTVTFFSDRQKQSIRYAEETIETTCLICGDEIEITKIGFNEKEADEFLPEILKGIRNRKKLLKLIEK